MYKQRCKCKYNMHACHFKISLKLKRVSHQSFRTANINDCIQTRASEGQKLHETNIFKSLDHRTDPEIMTVK